jgi:hypothetical protein
MMQNYVLSHNLPEIHANVPKTRVHRSAVKSTRLFGGSPSRFVPAERVPHTLHRTIKMSRRPLFQERK